MPKLSVGDFDHIEFVAVGISTASPDQRHLGLFYRGAENSLRFFHLAWHLRLKETDPEIQYGWIEPAIRASRRENLAAFCRRVSRKNSSGIPYAFSSPNDCFDAKTGEYLKGPTQLGLTCSMFVLALFHAVGLPLIKYETWQERPGDDLWRSSIVENLESQGKYPEHVSAIKAAPPAARVRPEDVAAAAYLAPVIPAGFEDVEKMAPEIVRELESRNLRHL